MNGLTHGTITDDSDVWVFGGQRIYKNFFNQDKHCEFFSAADVGKHFGLSREKLILLAMLTGSDYTDGIESVGPVTGLEILAEFQGAGLEPLREFKSWWNIANKNLAMPPGSRLREKFRKLRVPEIFPNERISIAYMNPDVDNSMEKFTWAIPNFVDIRDYASEKFGWTKGKIDEIIKPVLKTMSVKNSQERIDSFFMTSRIKLPEKGNYQSSKRVKEAIGRVLGRSEANGKKSDGKSQTKGKNMTEIKKSSQSASKKRKSDTKIVETEAKKVKDVEMEENMIVLPPKNWKAEEKAKQEASKKKAAEVMKKLRLENSQKGSKKSRYQVKRKIIQAHKLSESESD